MTLHRFIVSALAVCSLLIPWWACHAEDLLNVDRLLAERLAPEDLEQGWIRLFDGQSLMGWENAGNANWRVEEGVLVADSGDNSLLCTTVPFRDYEIVAEFRCAERTNSGLFLRTPPKPTDPAKDCFELNIAPADNPFPTGSFVFRQKVSEQIDAPKPGQWHTFRALLEGDHAQAWLNGRQTVDYRDSTNLEKGRVGLQFREGQIAFRNIRIRPIGKALLPGEASSFREPVQVKTQWDSNGSVILSGGRGHLETKATFGDGVLQFSALTLKPKVNSGLFFRCIPGEDMNGYECQLHHGYQDSRTKPVDSGTGAIFRRQAARAVLSDEDQKAYVTIVAEGPRIATWVQGIQTVDWVDTRKPDLNPRKGLRTEAGSIMLQGHDPECQVRFDQLRMAD